MNYKKIHDDIIQRSKNRIIQGYTEKHHIQPRCMGGTNEKNNIAILTAREHFIVHLLLFKIYPKNLALVKAIMIMTIGQYERKINNRFYERYKTKFSLSMSESQRGYKNSQYNKKWISDLENKTSIIVNKDYICIPPFVEGRYKWKKIEFQQNKEINRIKKIEEKKISFLKYIESYYNEYINGLSTRDIAKKYGESHVIWFKRFKMYEEYSGVPVIGSGADC